MKNAKAFVLGRRTARGTTVLFLRAPKKPILRGPWTVMAVVGK